MKRLFKIKLENLQLIGSMLPTFLVIYIMILEEIDFKMVVLLIVCICANIYSIVSYKEIKAMRKQILKEW